MILLLYYLYSIITPLPPWTRVTVASVIRYQDYHYRFDVSKLQPVRPRAISAVSTSCWLWTQRCDVHWLHVHITPISLVNVGRHSRVILCHTATYCLVYFKAYHKTISQRKLTLPCWALIANAWHHCEGHHGPISNGFALNLQWCTPPTNSSLTNMMLVRWWRCWQKGTPRSMDDYTSHLLRLSLERSRITNSGIGKLHMGFYDTPLFLSIEAVTWTYHHRETSSMIKH